MNLPSEKSNLEHRCDSSSNRYKKWKKLLLKELVFDYVKNSTLHGLRYLAENGLTSVEKLFWIVTFSTSIIISSILIKNLFVKWNTSPVIVAVSESLVSVGEIPFPSVTICPQIKSKATVYNFSYEFEKMRQNGPLLQQDTEKFLDVSMVCNMPVISMSQRNLTNASITYHLKNVAPNLSDIFYSCTWRDLLLGCDVLFEKVYTAEGLCYNMNGLAASEIFRDTIQKDYEYSDRKDLTQGWSLNDGYLGTEDNAFPRPGRDNGAIYDLQLILKSNIDDRDDLCNGMKSGFKIYIHHPTDYPQSSLYYYAALDEQLSSMAVSADIWISDMSLEKYSSEIRQCYFQKDRQLRYFKIYTTSNCRLECLSNYTYELCGCVGYFMPHNNSSEICAEKNVKCMSDAKIYLAQRELHIKKTKGGGGCQCLAACNSVEYSAEILKTEFHWKAFVERLQAYPDFTVDPALNKTINNFCQVDIYFKKPEFVSMRRSELFGFTDLLANIGGLLGLFLGFSISSLIEIFYFLTLRLGCVLIHNLK